MVDISFPFSRKFNLKQSQSLQRQYLLKESRNAQNEHIQLSIKVFSTTKHLILAKRQIKRNNEMPSGLLRKNKILGLRKICSWLINRKLILQQFYTRSDSQRTNHNSKLTKTKDSSLKINFVTREFYYMISLRFSLDS